MTEPSDQPGDEIRAGDMVAHRDMPSRVGHVDEVVKRGAGFFPLDLDSEIDRMAWVKWEERTSESPSPSPTSSNGPDSDPGHRVSPDRPGCRHTRKNSAMSYRPASRLLRSSQASSSAITTMSGLNAFWIASDRVRPGLQECPGRLMDCVWRPRPALTAQVRVLTTPDRVHGTVRHPAGRLEPVDQVVASLVRGPAGVQSVLDRLPVRVGQLVVDVSQCLARGDEPVSGLASGDYGRELAAN